MGKVLIGILIGAVIWIIIGLIVKYVNCLSRDDEFKLSTKDIKPVLLWYRIVFGLSR